MRCFMSIERMRTCAKDIAFKTFDLLSRTRVVQPAFQRVRPPPSAGLRSVSTPSVYESAAVCTAL